MFKITKIALIVHILLKIKAKSDCGCNANRNHIRFIDSDVAGQNAQCDQNTCSNNDFYTSEESNNLILVPQGVYQLGTDDVVIDKDMEGPKRLVKLANFYLDQYEVSNRDFIKFTAKTNYKTEAETFGDSFVFTLFLNSTFRNQLQDFRVVQAPWWYKVEGANWRHPHGPDSDISELLDHPVTHVSWNDAKKYCEWRGARLPSEAEWEAACRGGHRDTKYPWGDKLFPDRKYMANIWQGTFPSHNSVKDGYVGTNPVGMFQQNDFGFHNIAGNVWEWTEDSWSENNPHEKVKKGGSYLCHKSYCYRYRCSARSHNTQDSSAGNLGFRCAKSVH